MERVMAENKKKGGDKAEAPKAEETPKVEPLNGAQPAAPAIDANLLMGESPPENQAQAIRLAFRQLGERADIDDVLDFCKKIGFPDIQRGRVSMERGKLRKGGSRPRKRGRTSSDDVFDMLDELENLAQRFGVSSLERGVR